MPTATPRHLLRALALTVSLCLPAAHAGAAWFVGIGDEVGGSFDSNAHAVSNDGRVAAGATGQMIFDPPLPELPPLVVNDTRAAVWSLAGGLQLLPAEVMHAPDISADGTVVLGFTPDSGAFRSYLWTEAGGAVETGLGDLPRRLSEDGTTIVGRASADGTSWAFRWSAANGFENLGALPATNPRSEAWGVSADGSVVAAKSRNVLNAPGFVWAEGVGIEALDPIDGAKFVNGISGDGQTVFGTVDGESFLWTGSGGYVLLGNTFNAGIPKLVRDTTHDGTTAVGGNFATTFSAAFVWDAENGMRELAAVLENDYGIDLTGWTLLQANGISPNGLYIVGEAINPDGNDEGFVVYLGSGTGCGLGAELALLLPALALGRRRRLGRP
jgi:uncharacterized membrane protein